MGIKENKHILLNFFVYGSLFIAALTAHFADALVSKSVASVYDAVATL